MVAAWFNGEAEKPAAAEERFHAILVRGGVVHIVESNLFPVEYRVGRIAVGSGRDFAMAAMFLGKSAVEAVRVAHALDPDTGPEIETLEYSFETVNEGR